MIYVHGKQPFGEVVHSLARRFASRGFFRIRHLCAWFIARSDVKVNTVLAMALIAWSMETIYKRWDSLQVNSKRPSHVNLNF